MSTDPGRTRSAKCFGCRKIGVFDSGVGGLSVWKEIVELLPHEHILYFADQAHCPYGARSLQEIRSFCESIVEFLIAQGAGLIVVACNTASAASLYYLRERFSVPIVGMEPAVKPAVERTVSGRVGVMATPATFEGEPFDRLMRKFGQNSVVIRRECPGLVARVEAGILEGEEIDSVLEPCLRPMLDQGVDVIALGCTHYPFVRRAIERIAGPRVEVIDPAPAVARQVMRIVYGEMGLSPNAELGQRLFYTSGDRRSFEAMLQKLLGRSGDVRKVIWTASEISRTDIEPENDHSN